MFILVEVDVYKFFCNSIFFFSTSVLVFKILGGFMKCGVRRSKTAEKGLKMAIFKLLVLYYMHTTLYFSFFLIEQYEQVLCCVKIQEKV